MNTTIQIFENAEFGKVRTMTDSEGEPLFCAKDVCDALGYKKTSNAIAQHVDEGDALKQGTPPTEESSWTSDRLFPSHYTKLL